MMRKKDKIEELMDTMDQPEVNVSLHQQQFRLTVLNARKSAIAGVVLLILPFLFLSGVVLKHYLQIDFGILTSVYEWIGQLDEQFGDNSLLNWLLRAFLTLGPLAAIAVNLLAVTHASIDKTTRELIISFKLKWLNWLIILLCTSVFIIFFLYLLIENA